MPIGLLDGDEQPSSGYKAWVLFWRGQTSERRVRWAASFLSISCDEGHSMCRAARWSENERARAYPHLDA